LTNFSNGKQTQKSLESGFPENEFRETNMALKSDLKDGRTPSQSQMMMIAEKILKTTT
jgi:hypothetical protein